MLIVGAKGFAKEVLEVICQERVPDNLAFFDDINPEVEGLVYNRFPILKNDEAVRSYFKDVDNRFTIGIGGPVLRYNLSLKFMKLGGEFTSTISPKATIGIFGNSIGIGVNLMSGSVVTGSISIGEGTLINLNCTIGHDTLIGKYVEVSPGVSISGNCTIGDFCNIGTGAVILPKVKLGRNVIIGAGAVVTKDISDNSLAIGVPASVVKNLEPLNIY
ncbi:acetyltransferase [Cesiribacter sp. SM1]|uniref:acetyltransferase n=1 Tax=Cesiribacter sp. SM1 TaxID=2861196 RepID=UPI001CD76B91|nr:acetyltransferase [Cesiribacter sp. SM1]